jgi:hypothetical protein
MTKTDTAEAVRYRVTGMDLWRQHFRPTLAVIGCGAGEPVVPRRQLSPSTRTCGRSWTLVTL